MKDILLYINEAAKKDESNKKYIAIDILTTSTDEDNNKIEKQSYKVILYDTYLDIRKDGYTKNGDKIVYMNAISPSCQSKESAKEYIAKIKNKDE